jgi:hypothetical protein
MTAKKKRTPATPLEKRIASCIQVVSYPLGSKDKSFAKTIVYEVQIEEGITHGQREYMLSVLYKYRRQIPVYAQLEQAVFNEYGIKLQKGYIKLEAVE